MSNISSDLLYLLKIRINGPFIGLYSLILLLQTIDGTNILHKLSRYFCRLE